jgi:hypothetical protein
MESTSNTDPVTNRQITEYYDNFNDWIANPVGIIVIIIIIIGLILIIGFNKNSESSGNILKAINIKDDSNKSNKYSLAIVIILALIFAYLIVNFFQYFLNVNIWTSLTNIFNPEADLDINIQSSDSSTDPVPEIKILKQVFNIPGNTYSYPDAKALCSAYGSELASYSQIEQSYEKGAEWCNYGWSAGQMALFPTQQKTFDNLQDIPDHENDCGRPGINGGFMENPGLKFGANCYGYKPKITSVEQELMSSQTPYPLTKKDIAMQNRIGYWKTKINDILVSPFNYKNWSKI